MVQDLLTLCKLIVLYMLSRVTFPMTAAQISDFLLEREYTNYLTLQPALGELTEAGMIRSQTIRNRTHLTITEEGLQTLRYFENRINDGIRKDVDQYLIQKEFALRNELSIQGNYYKSTSGDYEARLIARDRGKTLIELTLSVPTPEIASSICDNWQEHNQDIYQYLIQQLF